MSISITRRTGNLLGFFACVALMAYALYAQYVLVLEPCPLCIFQRAAVITLGVLFLAAAVHNPAQRGARVYAGLQLLAVTVGVLVSSRHIWIQMQPPGSVEACGASLDYLFDILPPFAVIKKVLFGSGECGTIDWRFLGLSMPWWVAISQVVLGAWALFVNAPARPTATSNVAVRQ